MARSFAEINPTGRSYIGQLVTKALEDRAFTQSPRPQKLSPSMFPVCSVIQRMKWEMFGQLGYLPREEGCALEIFAKAGTGMHETMQFFMGRGGKLWGHWNCRNKKCKMHERSKSRYDANGKRIKKGIPTRTCSTDNKCPECGHDMEYREFKIYWKMLKGFVDGVIKMPDGTYWVIDFKSASIKKIDSDTFYDKKHGQQLSTYVWVLERKYNIKISGYSLVYLPRDNPFKFGEKPFTWGDEERKSVGSMVRKQHRLYKTAKTDYKEGKISNCIKCKPCSSEKFYYKHMHGYNECPMLDYCFKPDRLQRALASWVAACRDKKVPVNVGFDDAVRVVTDREFNRKRKLPINHGKPGRIKDKKPRPVHVQL